MELSQIKEWTGSFDDLFAFEPDGVAVEFGCEFQIPENDAVDVDVFEKAESAAEVEILRGKPFADPGGVFLVGVIVNDIRIGFARDVCDRRSRRTSG